MLVLRIDEDHFFRDSPESPIRLIAADRRMSTIDSEYRTIQSRRQLVRQLVAPRTIREHLERLGIICDFHRCLQTVRGVNRVY